MRKPIIFAVFLLGLTAMAAQIVLLRQMVVSFYGNELALGLMLGAWLFWTGIGSWAMGRFSDRIKDRRFIFSLLQLILSFVLLGVIFILRNTRAILGVFAGEIIGFLPMLGVCFGLLALPGLILGFLFTLACRIFPAEKENTAGAVSIGQVYILEAIGAAFGGCLVSFFLIRWFDGLYIMLGLGALNLISAYLLTRRLIIKSLSLALILTFSFLLISQRAEELKEFSLQRQWQGVKVLSAEDSIYSNLVLTQQNDQYSFFSNGNLLFTVPDEVAAEEAVHFALLQITRPQNVLLIGGGPAGLAEQAFKHPLNKLDYVELDPEIIRLGRKFLPKARLNALEDKRVSIFHQDGRLFVQKRNLFPDSARYDCIIIQLGNPYTAQINRFYSVEFFAEVKKSLAEGGVLSFGLSSAENFINTEQAQFLAAIYQTLTKVFSDVKVIPGDTAYFLAADKKGILTYDYHQLILRLKQRHIQNKFVNEYYLAAKLSPDRIEYLEGRIKQQKETALNRDFRPICYYYDMVLWSTHFTRHWRSFFARINIKIVWAFFFILYPAVLITGFLFRRKSSGRDKTVVLAVLTTGLTEISFQVIILLAFQIIYGYLYYKLGIILSFFMIGLVLGARVITARLQSLGNNYRLFIKTQFVISFYPLILPVIFYALGKSAGNSPANWLGSNIIFPLLPIISGFIGGFQFPLANKIILKESAAVGRTAGLSYGMDLLGACLGALLVSAFLVPILGILQTCLAIALLNTIVLLSLMLNST